MSRGALTTESTADADVDMIQPTQIDRLPPADGPPPDVCPAHVPPADGPADGPPTHCPPPDVRPAHVPPAHGPDRPTTTTNANLSPQNETNM